MAVFALTQTVGYGSLIQSFTVLLIPISHDLGVSRSEVTAAVTIPPRNPVTGLLDS